MKRKIFSLLLAGVFFVSVFLCLEFATSADTTSAIKNVIYMIPDGGGMALFDFANAVKEQGGFIPDMYPNSTKVEVGAMNMKEYLVGTEITRSYDNSVTDSAAAGTALSSGYKTKNKYIGVDPDGVPRASILEAVQLAGKKTGICTTVEWSHATPAAFTAHNVSRENYSILSEQIVNQGIDVVLGVGFGAARWGSINEALNRGYTVVKNKTELADVTQGTKLWGNLSNTAFPFDINLSSSQPTLAEMTSAAIRVLEGTEDGFFLMVEGSKVDYGGHDNNILQAISEYLAFDAAFKVAVDYAKTRTDTIVIALPDHDTGGLVLPNADALGGNPNSNDYAAAVADVRAGINSKNGIRWETGNHTARNCGIWMYVPSGVDYPQGLSSTPGDTSENRGLSVDNTEIVRYIANLVNVNLDAATQKLFRDVTSSGIYNSSNGVFTFTDYPVSVKANTSVATINSQPYDLKGQVTVYSNNRFYVPNALYNYISDEVEEKPVIVKNVRYIDDMTGKVLIKGQLDKALAGKRTTLLLSKKSATTITSGDIGYIDQAIIDNDGFYIFKFNFQEDVNDYELKMYLGDELITSSITSATASYSWLDTSLNLLLKVDSLVSSKIVINNYYDLDGLTYTVGLAFYNDNDILIGFHSSEDIKPVENGITIDSLNATLVPGTEKVKVMVWSNYVQLIPLCTTEMVMTD